MTPQHCRAARAWLGWSQTALADAADIGRATIKDFETGNRQLSATSLIAIQAALEKEGIAFIEGDAPGISYKASVSQKDDVASILDDSSEVMKAIVRSAYEAGRRAGLANSSDRRRLPPQHWIDRPSNGI